MEMTTEQTITKYKDKYTQIAINANKGMPYLYMGDTVVINLCSCFIKKGNFVKYITMMRECLPGYNKINFCNLASMCYKMDIKYNSLECLDFIQVLIQLTKHEFPDVQFIQNEIFNFGELDCKPIENLIKLDTQKSIIYVNSVLLDCLKYLGYATTQLWDILTYTKNFNFIIPPDIIKLLPIKNEANDTFYNSIKEYLLS